MPMSGDAVIVVAPAEVDFSDDAHFDTVEAFAPAAAHVRASAPRHVALGPVSRRRRPTLRIFNIQGRGYPNDNTVVRFAQDLGLAYDVRRPTRGLA